jgi:hypothetical protein
VRAAYRVAAKRPADTFHGLCRILEIRDRERRRRRRVRDRREERDGAAENEERAHVQGKYVARILACH